MSIVETKSLVRRVHQWTIKLILAITTTLIIRQHSGHMMIAGLSHPPSFRLKFDINGRLQLHILGLKGQP